MTLAKKALTDRAIVGAKPAEEGKRRIVWDAIVPGLGLRVTDNGTKSFVLVTRYPGSPNPAPRALGTYGRITLAQARTKAQEWLKQIAAGVDPGILAIETRAETVSAIAEEYFKRKAKDLRTRDTHKAILARLLPATIANKPIASVSRSEIVKLMDSIEDTNGPQMANRVLEIIGRVFDWHATRSDTYRSPIVKGMKRGTANARSRILSDEELRKVWLACDKQGVFGSLVKWLLLTATRRAEANYATRAEIVDGDWTIPASRYKTKIDHVVPLSQAAMSVLRSLNTDSEWLFTANGKQAIGSLSLRKAELDKASGTSGWTLHDLRRTARTLMSRAGIDGDHAERALGHVIGGVRGVYNRHEYHREKAQAFETLASIIKQIVEGADDHKVVRMKR